MERTSSIFFVADLSLRAMATVFEKSRTTTTTNRMLAPWKFSAARRFTARGLILTLPHRKDSTMQHSATSLISLKLKYTVRPVKKKRLAAYPFESICSSSRWWISTFTRRTHNFLSYIHMFWHFDARLKLITSDTRIHATGCRIFVYKNWIQWWLFLPRCRVWVR